jgi:DME family drug/metabolite transporter
MRSPVRAAALLIVVAVAWGAIPLIVREDIAASQLVAARVWLGGAALASLLAVQGRLRMPSRYRGRLVAVGVLRAAHWASFFLALKATTVAVTLAVLYLGPIAAAIVAPRLLGERPQPRVYAGLALAFGGVTLVVQPWASSDAGVTAEGVMWATISAGLLAIVMVIAKPAAELHGGLVVATAELVVAAIVLSPWAVAAATQASSYWWQFLVLGIVLTGVAGALYWSAMGRLSVSTVSVLMHLEPASAAIWALIALGEQPGAIAWVGIGAVIAGGMMAVSSVEGEEATYVPAAV